MGVTIVVLIGIGIYLRLRHFGFPSTFLFDEHHFVENARRYLDHRSDENDHPPLGKLVIAAFMARLGDNPVGWRAAALVAGMGTLILGAAAGARLFRTPLAACSTAALLSADGFFISYSRAALLDGFLAMCAIAALLMSTLPVTAWTALAGGLLAGVAMNIKFSGLGVIPPLCLALVLSRQDWKRKVALGALFTATAMASYVALYAYGLSVARHSATPSDVVADTWRLLVHHAELTDMKNPMTSGWVTWALPWRPIVLYGGGRLDAVRVITSLGNLATWWAAVAVGCLSLGAIVRSGTAATLNPGPPEPGTSPRVSAFVAEQGRSVLLALAVSLGFLAPWVMTHRDSYIYHFLPSYAGLVVLLGGYLGWVHARAPFAVLLFLLVVLLVAAFYAPVWATIPVTSNALRWRLLLESWR